MPLHAAGRPLRLVSRARRHAGNPLPSPTLRQWRGRGSGCPVQGAFASHAEEGLSFRLVELASSPAGRVPCARSGAVHGALGILVGGSDCERWHTPKEEDTSVCSCANVVGARAAALPFSP